METLMEYVDVGIGNEEDCEAVFGIKADGTDFEAGNVNEASYSIVADKMVKQYGLKMRRSRSARAFPPTETAGRRSCMTVRTATPARAIW